MVVWEGDLIQIDIWQGIDFFVKEVVFKQLSELQNREGVEGLFFFFYYIYGDVGLQLWFYVLGLLEVGRGNRINVEFVCFSFV